VRPLLLEAASGFDRLGLTAFTTTRQAGDFSCSSREPAGDMLRRWADLGAHATVPVERIALAHQAHGTDIVVHDGTWRGILRGWDADGHFATGTPTLMTVTLADCVPIFIGHSSGAAAVLHSGWKGTAAQIVNRGIALFASHGMRASELTVHCGPAICGDCYQVRPDVYARLTGETVDHPTPVDLRAIIASQARQAGVSDVSVSDSCTRCHNDRFFSHRCGDVGRQIGIIVSR
jgi:hypothetical protein